MDFQFDTYETPPGTPQVLGDRLAMGSGAYFYSRFIGIILKSRWRVARGKYDRNAFIESGTDTLRLIEGCNGRFHITGIDHLRNCTEPVVFVSNHMSALENNVFPGIIGQFKPFTFVVKESLLRYPVFGPLLASQNPIPLGRSDPRADLKLLMDEGCERLTKGISVLVFPQGTRTNSIDPQSFNTIGVKLARKAGVNILPIAVKTDYWQNGERFRDFGPINRDQPIYIAFGEPILVSKNSRQAHQQALDFISGYLTHWQNKILNS
ncbi:MAG: 1-acyl-sn-glycerol-3-phosphate acyltransferase [Chloroflexi bacterium]|nr:MAG: 1-acyl-sn-glycerol-3-phosphate acyltransferase [Chloroflexota bacterium]